MGTGAGIELASLHKSGAIDGVIGMGGGGGTYMILNYHYCQSQNWYKSVQFRQAYQRCRIFGIGSQHFVGNDRKRIIKCSFPTILSFYFESPSMPILKTL